jgi:hypothetical protein
MSDELTREPDETSASFAKRHAASKMTNQALVKRVKKGFEKIKAELPYIRELRERFRKLPRGGANISGCATWATFCIEVLHRSDRHIRRVLAEENEPVPVVIDRSPVAPVQLDTPEETGHAITHARERDKDSSVFNTEPRSYKRETQLYRARVLLEETARAVELLAQCQRRGEFQIDYKLQWKLFQGATKRLMDALETVNAEPVEAAQ